MDNFNEAFRVQYNGRPEDLREMILALNGVSGVSVDAPFEDIVVDTAIDCDIEYDAYETDRTRIRQQLEKTSEVKSVISA